ncbi:MAG: Nramp family divalent metal transporter [Planctomycetota bacterium]|nr:Nramp family divalent metal transporter [Planctomycetota bacterium]
MGVFEPLEKLKSDDMPEKKLPFWKMAGPGAVLVGLSIGAGEIIIWPRITAEFGATMIWAAVMGVFLQLWINLEVGRWTIATGETVFTGYARVWRGFAPVFILLTFVAWIAPGWARASGLALKALIFGPEGWGSDTFWTTVTFGMAALILFGPKIMYKSVERSIEAMVIIVTIGLIVVVFAVGSADTWKQLGNGILNVGHRETEGAYWLATDAGAFKFHNGTSVIFDGTRDLKGGKVLSVFRPKGGPLYFGTEQGALSFDGLDFKPVEGLQDRKVTAISETKKTLWFGTDQGLYRQKEDTLTRTECPVQSVVDLLLISDDKTGAEELWIAGGDLYRWNGEGFHKVRTRTRNFKAICEGENGSVWAATWGELYHIADGKVTEHKNSLPERTFFQDIALALDGSVWIASNKGMYQFKGGKLNLSFSERGFSRVLIERDGSVWAAATAHTLFKKTGETFVKHSFVTTKKHFVRSTDINGIHRDHGMAIKAFFIAIVFAGAGGTANLFYTFYLRDKNIGMGALVPETRNPLRDRDEAVPSTGFTWEATEENTKRFKAWWKYIIQDQTFFFFGLNTVTILLFIFAALAVLYPNGIVPPKGKLIYGEAVVLGSVWGPTGRTIFLIVGVATLFGTQLALIDGVARSMADIIYTNFKGAKKRGVGWWYMMFAGGWMIAGCLITWILEQWQVSDLTFLFNAAYMGGFAMALYVPLTLFINYRYLPKPARPGPVCTVMMLVASTVYVGFAIACLGWEAGLW